MNPLNLLPLSCILQNEKDVPPVVLLLEKIDSSLFENTRRSFTKRILQTVSNKRAILRPMKRKSVAK